MSIMPDVAPYMDMGSSTSARYLLIEGLGTRLWRELDLCKSPWLGLQRMESWVV
jgi:hypothetical protein